MRLPQVSERIKEAPAQALRGVFAGIGQLLLITDKLRNKPPAHDDAPRAAARQPAPAPEPSQAPEPPVAETAKDLDKTGNVRVITEPVAAEAPEPVAPVPAAPLPNYDALTVASLRARLRNLSVDQVRELAEYEKAHAARSEVITMFERRVAKLEADA